MSVMSIYSANPIGHIAKSHHWFMQFVGLSPGDNHEHIRASLAWIALRVSIVGVMPGRK